MHVKLWQYLLSSFVKIEITWSAFTWANHAICGLNNTCILATPSYTECCRAINMLKFIYPTPQINCKMILENYIKKYIISKCSLMDLQLFLRHSYFFIRDNYKKSLGVVELKHLCTLTLIISHTEFEIPQYEERSRLSWVSYIICAFLPPLLIKDLWYIFCAEEYKKENKYSGE